MPEFDLLIRGATPLTKIGITDGKFAGFNAGSAREEIDATGLLVLPGIVDAHVHFNEPGRADWEGWATGSRSAIAGGVTTVCDMPLNSTPPVINIAAFDAKLQAARTQSACDFALWGGLVPGSLGHLKPLAERGVIGFKAFMSDSGIEDFPKTDLATLREAMFRATELDLPVAVHAEIDREIPASGQSVEDYLASRPVEMELEAIHAALEIAEETDCALHIVHVSSGRGVALIAEARARGVNVTCETCPHYLIFTGDDMVRLGAVAKCAPPMREDAERTALWEHLRAGRIDTIGSDHSPSPWNLKERANFFQVWGGISGVQHLAPVLIEAGLDPLLLAQFAARNPAERFRLAHKGRLEVGTDADLFLVEPNADYEVTAESLFYRHRRSPYIGRRLRARVDRTILRGKTIFLNGQFVGKPAGEFLKPL
ncbi:MAG TPA: allantoinase AllB [Candidatus Limnocylindria bacterium]|nr:allantoinase AllB [Candidatus Limnocylindria bacterium]